jgi:localization factor PodJL
MNVQQAYRPSGNGQAQDAAPPANATASADSALRVPVADLIASFGERQSTAEARLYTTEQGSPIRTGFPPIDELASRLGEFVQKHSEEKPRQRTKTEVPPVSMLRTWLAEQFDGLNQSLSRHEQSLNRLEAVEAKVTSLSARVDRVEREPALEADRIARAASEIMAAASNLDRTRELFLASAERAKREAIADIKETAIDAAAIAVKRVELAVQTSLPPHLASLDAKIEALAAQAAATEDRTATRLDAVTKTLSDFLEKRLPSGKAGAQRPSMHLPIGAASMYDPPFAGSAFKSGGSVADRLRPQTRETRPKTDPRQQSKDRNTAKFKSGPGDDGRGFPLYAIGAVAFLMILASLVLYAMHLSNSRGYSHRQDRSAAITGQQSQGTNLLASAVAGREPMETDHFKRTFDDASNGDAEAQYRVALRLMERTENRQSALRWLRRAADQDHREAQFRLAKALEEETGNPVALSEAVVLYRKAAEAGHIRAMHNLGVLLHRQPNTEGDVEAAKWFAKAAAAGVTESQYNLALFYEKGLGVARDLAKAALWYEAAANSGDAAAKADAERVKALLAPGSSAHVSQASGWKTIVTR